MLRFVFVIFSRRYPTRNCSKINFAGAKTPTSNHKPVVNYYLNLCTLREIGSILGITRQVRERAGKIPRDQTRRCSISKTSIRKKRPDSRVFYTASLVSPKTLEQHRRLAAFPSPKPSRLVGVAVIVCLVPVPPPSPRQRPGAQAGRPHPGSHLPTESIHHA